MTICQHFFIFYSNNGCEVIYSFNVYAITKQYIRNNLMEVDDDPHNEIEVFKDKT